MAAGSAGADVNSLFGGHDRLAMACQKAEKGRVRELHWVGGTQRGTWLELQVGATACVKVQLAFVMHGGHAYDEG